MEIKKFKWIFFLITILKSLIFSIEQINENSALKALSCVTLVTAEFHNKKEEPSVYSPYVLSCFMKIKEEQAQDILSNLDEGINLTKEEIDELIDINSLKNFSEDEVKRKSEELEYTMQEFKKLDEEYNKENENYDDKLNDMVDDDDYDEDYTYDNNTHKFSKKNFMDLIKRGIKGFFNVVNSIWYAIFILAILYISLKIIRLIFKSENNMNKKNLEETKEEKNNDNKNNEKEEKDLGKKEFKEKKDDKGKEKLKKD